MSVKKISILVIILAFLGGLYYFTETSSADKKKKASADFVPGFDKSKAFSIMVKSPEKGESLLKNENGAWKVTSKEKTYDADSAAVSKLLDTILKIKQETIASKNPKNFEAFEVTEGKGLEVKIDDASQKPLAHFFVGKSGPDIFSTYMRAKDSATVVLAGGLLRNAFDQELKDWRDKAIWRINKDDIIEYAVEGDMTLHMKKDEKGAWQVLRPEAFTAKKDAAEKSILKIAALKAADFSEGSLSEFQLDAPKRKITATLKGGKAETLLVGKDKNAFQYFVKTSLSDPVYVVEKSELEALCPGLDALKEPEKKEEKKSDNATNQ